MIKVRKNKAFSLIELMVAMFIFVTCLLLIFGIFPTAVQAVTQGRYVFLANQVARKEMEYLKSLDWDKLAEFQTLALSDPDLFYRKTTLNATVNGVESSATFESNPMITVFAVDGDGQPEILSIRVVVKYSYGSAIQKDQSEYYKIVELETLWARL